MTGPRSFAVVMPTLDRSPGPNYLSDTLASLARARVFDDPRIASFQLVDSGSLDGRAYLECALRDQEGSVLRNLSWSLPDIRRSLNLNVAHCLRIASQQGADWVLYLEDDIDVCSDFLAGLDLWLDDHELPDCVLYSLGSTSEQLAAAKDAPRTGAQLLPLRVFWGTQAILIRSADAYNLSCFLDDVQKYSASGDGSDVVMLFWSIIHHPDAVSFMVAYPSHVQHMGRESAVQADRFHEFTGWEGREWSYANLRSSWRE